MRAIAILLLLVTPATAGPTFVCPLVCQRSRPVITDGVVGTELDRCRCARDEEAAPTPKPTPLPTPNPADCPNPLPPSVYPGEYYVDTRIADGATQRYCFTLTTDTVAVDFNAIDITGAAQCFWATAFTVTPPLGSGLQQETDFGRNPHLGYFRSGQLIPRGHYTLAVTARTGSNCDQRYRLSARWR